MHQRGSTNYLFSVEGQLCGLHFLPHSTKALLLSSKEGIQEMVYTEPSTVPGRHFLPQILSSCYFSVFQNLQSAFTNVCIFYPPNNSKTYEVI